MASPTLWLSATMRLASPLRHSRRAIMTWRKAVRAVEPQPRTTPTPAIRFGEREWWDGQYAAGTAAQEWFLSSQTAAESAADLWRAHLARHRGSCSTSLRVLHVGCGTSALGAHVAEALVARGGASGVRVMNVDYSEAAVSEAQQAAGHRTPGLAHGEQRWHVWDATQDGPPPPIEEVPVGAGTPPYDLVLDKGTLDALLFQEGTALEAYLASLRGLLHGRHGSEGAADARPPSRPPPLLAHFSDEPPDVRGALLAAAFPVDEGWLVECAEVAPVDDDLEGRHACFRYAVGRSQAWTDRLE